jgi:hypothetical protein
VCSVKMHYSSADSKRLAIETSGHAIGPLL